jgi:hypothetical protein
MPAESALSGQQLTKNPKSSTQITLIERRYGHKRAKQNWQ